MFARALFIAVEILFILLIAAGVGMIYLPAGVIVLGVAGLGLCFWQDDRR